MKLSIVTTLYRSAPYLPEFYERATKAAKELAGTNYEMILVNDGSPDNSLDLAVELQKKDPNVVVVDLSRNFGHHRAMMTGLQFAKGELVYLLDSDLEEEPEWLLTFEAELKKNGGDVVYGVQDRRKGGLFERCSGDFFYKIFNLLSATPIPANTTIARLMTRRYVQALVRHQEREIFMPGLWQITGFNQTAQFVVKHSKGTSTYNLTRKIALFVNAITAFSDRPLVFTFYTGALMSLSAGAYIIRLFYAKWAHDVPIQGWPSLIVSIWFLGGLTIFFIGVLGIYLAKVYVEIKQRPYALVRQVFPDERAH